MGNRRQELRQGFLWTDYAHGLRTGIRNNSVVSLRSTPDGPGSLRPSICIAYGYSLLATVGFAALGSLAGSPSIRQMFLYGIGASVGFEFAFARRAERVRQHS